MIRYYISPVVDDGLTIQQGGKGIHAKLLDYISPQVGAETSIPGVHPSGWTLVYVNAPDHSELDAAPDIIDALNGFLDTTMLKISALNRADMPVSPSMMAGIQKNLQSKGLNTVGVSTAKQVLETYLHAIDPSSSIIFLGSAA